LGKRLLDNKFLNSLLEAVLIISNSIDSIDCNIDFRYKASISYISQILAVIYLEKTGRIENRLYKYVNVTQSKNTSLSLRNIIDFQLRHTGIKDRFFNNFQVKINDKHSSVLIKVLKKIIVINELEPEFFGYLYEYFQKFCLQINKTTPDDAQLKLFNDKSGYDYFVIPTKSNRKSQGSFFTPPELISHLIRSGLSDKIADISSPDELLELKILDPACGGGNILLEIYKFLYDKALENFNQNTNLQEIKRLILKNCIFGMDIDDLACEITKLALFLTSGHFEHLYNIQCKNFLTDNTDKFSLIIGNPPYLNIQNIPKAEKEYYLKNFKTAFRRFDIYLLFIEKALESLQPGTLSFIIPDKFLTQTYAKKSRELILKNHTIREIISFSNQNLFKDANVSPVIITIDSQQRDKDIKVNEILSNGETISFINQKTFWSMPDFIFRIGWNVHKQEIIEHIQSKSFPLYELCYASWGAQAGDAKKFIFKSRDQADPIYQESLKPLIKGGNIDRYSISYTGEYLLYLTEGAHKLHRPAFPELFESNKIVIAEVTAKKGIIASLDRQKFYTNHSVINCIHKKDLLNINPEILNTRGIKIFNTGHNPDYKWQEDELAYIRGCDIYKDSIFNGYDIRYIISIINSQLINFYFKNLLSGNLNVFPGLVKFMPVLNLGAVTNTDLKPVKAIFENNRFEDLEKLLNKCIVDKDFLYIHNILCLATDKLLEFNQSSGFSFFETLDNIINNAIYKLYGLNLRQIEYVKNNHIK
jgi:type I restriction-modification system DNA methylase subunit